MRYYETLYLINPNLSDEEYGEVVAKFSDLVAKKNGVLINADEWGKKTLAYAVKKFDKGFYVLIQYCGPGEIIAGIERDMRLDERILKFQTVKLSDQVDPEELKATIEKKKMAAEEATTETVEDTSEEENKSAEEDKPEEEDGE